MDEPGLWKIVVAIAMIIFFIVIGKTDKKDE